MPARRGLDPSWVEGCFVRSMRRRHIRHLSAFATATATRTVVHGGLPTDRGFGKSTKTLTTAVTATTTAAHTKNPCSASALLHLQVSDPVQEALLHGRPVVALESTIVAHGMPYPQNLELSHRVATILRDQGVEPATIGTYGVLDVCVCVCVCVASVQDEPGPTTRKRVTLFNNFYRKLKQN